MSSTFDLMKVYRVVNHSYSENLMLLLVDYDNIQEADRRIGLEHVVRKAISYCDDGTRAVARIRVRLYGGWYEGGKLTRAGQLLYAEIRGCSPLRIAWQKGLTIVLADVELASTTLSDPRTVITNTSRRRGFPRGVRCESRPWLSCRDNLNCPLALVEQFLEQDVCGFGGCSVRPQEVFYRQEQKVVDAMMVADLIFDAQATKDWNSVVSRDDDIWPALSIACAHSKRLTHISTASATRVPSYYNSLATPPYHRVHWS